MHRPLLVGRVATQPKLNNKAPNAGCQCLQAPTLSNATGSAEGVGRLVGSDEMDVSTSLFPDCKVQYPYLV
jgi:hypothetical protein